MKLDDLESAILSDGSALYEDTGARIRTVEFKTKQDSKIAYRVDLPAKLAGSRIRKQFPTLGAAVDWIEDWTQQRSTTKATLREANDFNTNLPRLREHGITISALLDFYEGRFIPEGNRLRLSDIQALLLETLDKRQESKLSDHHRRKIAVMGERIKSDFDDCFADEVTAKKTVEWLENAKASEEKLWSGKTRNHYLAHLNRLIEFAISKKALKANPLAEIDDETRKSLLGYKVPAPEVLTLEEAKALLEATREHCDAMLPCVILSLFDGLRQHEAWQLKASDINFEDNEVHISERIAKTRSIRFVELSEASLMWLNTCDLPKKGRLLPFSVKSAEGRWATIMKKAKVHKQNALRHTAASVMCRLKGETFAKSQLGHAENSATLFRHYRKAMTRTEAEKFADLRPEESNIVRFRKTSCA